MEDPPDVRAQVRVEVLVAGPLLGRHEVRDRLARHDGPERVDGVADDAGVSPVPQEAVVDRGSRARVARAEADPPTGVRLERVRDAGRLVAPALRAAGDPRQEMPVPGPVRARAAPQPDEDLRLEEPVQIVLPHRALEVGRRRPGDADTGMVDEPLADGELVGDRLDAVPPELLGGADAAAQEDRRRRRRPR